MPSQSTSRDFAVGDLVRLVSGEWAGREGKITDHAHPASPWRWVVRGYGDEGPCHQWGTAVNDDEIELANAAA